MNQTIDLIDLIDTRLVKVIDFKLPEVSYQTKWRYRRESRSKA